MDIVVPQGLVSLAEAYAQTKQLAGDYALLEAWVVPRAGRLDVFPSHAFHEGAPEAVGAVPVLFASATVAIGSPTPIDPSTPEPREMRLLADRYGWKRIRHGVYAKVLGTRRLL